MRTAFIDELCLLAAERSDIVLLCGDLGYSVLERFSERFPNRFYNVGICEQNMAGLAAGLALSGKCVVTYSINNFAIARCLEQIRDDICYHDCSVLVTSVGAGAAYGTQGYTHHGIEDIAFTRTLPNMAVASPADPSETRSILRLLIDRRRPASLRLARGGEPLVHSEPPAMTFGQALTVRPVGKDANIVAHGAVVPDAVAAADILAGDGLDVGVLSVPFVAPLDEQAIAHVFRSGRIVVSVEEHVYEGGFGGAVAELAAGLSGPRARLVRTGIPPGSFKIALDQKAVRQRVGIDAKGLAARVRDELKQQH